MDLEAQFRIQMGLSNNPYFEPNQFPVLTPPLRSIQVFSSHLRLNLPKRFFLMGSPIKILKAFLPSSILAIRLAHLNLLDLIALNK